MMLRADGIESAAIGLAHPIADADNLKLILTDVRLPYEADYRRRSSAETELSPEFVASAVREARDRRLSTIFLHTHPFSRHPDFSEVDTRGEKLLREFLDRRLPGLPHAAMVLGTESPAARLLGNGQALSVSVIGGTVQRFDRRTEGE